MVAFNSRITTNTISNYMKGYWENTQNHRVALQALMKRGNINRGMSGYQFVWNVRGGRYTSQAYDELQSIDITRTNQKFQCSLPWSFLEVHDGISRDEIAMASGEWALVKEAKIMCKNMSDDFETRINSNFLNNNGATLTGNVIYGLPTVFQDSGSFVAANRLQTSSGTYAGQSLVNGSIGIDSPDTNVWTPALVNSTSTSFNSGSAATWAGQCLKIITYAKDQITYGTMEDDQPDVLITDRQMFSDLKYAITQQQRMLVTVRPGDKGPQGLGISNAVEHDGLEVIFDADQPANTGYLLNFHKINMDVLAKPGVSNPGPDLAGKGDGGDFFDVTLTEDDIRTNGILARVNFRGQVAISPRHQAKIYPYA